MFTACLRSRALRGERRPCGQTLPTAAPRRSRAPGTRRHTRRIRCRSRHPDGAPARRPAPHGSGSRAARTHRRRSGRRPWPWRDKLRQWSRPVSTGRCRPRMRCDRTQVPDTRARNRRRTCIHRARSRRPRKLRWHRQSRWGRPWRNRRTGCRREQTRERDAPTAAAAVPALQSDRTGGGDGWAASWNWAGRFSPPRMPVTSGRHLDLAQVASRMTARLDGIAGCSKAAICGKMIPT